VLLKVNWLRQQRARLRAQVGAPRLALVVLQMRKPGIAEVELEGLSPTCSCCGISIRGFFGCSYLQDFREIRQASSCEITASKTKLGLLNGWTRS